MITPDGTAVHGRSQIATILSQLVARRTEIEVEQLVLRRAGGLRPAVRVDTATAALVGASEGTLTVAALVAAVASVLGDDPQSLSARLLPVVRDLVGQGLLEPS